MEIRQPNLDNDNDERHVTTASIVVSNGAQEGTGEPIDQAIVPISLRGMTRLVISGRKMFLSPLSSISAHGHVADGGW